MSGGDDGCLGDYPCIQMPTTDNYRVGHGETFKKESLRCPQCKAFVNKEDGECWACGCTLAEPSFDESEGYFLDNKEEL